jgi:hypothetical protein
MKTNYRNAQIVIRDERVVIWLKGKIYDAVYEGDINELEASAKKWIDIYMESDVTVNKLSILHGYQVIKGLQQTKDLAEKFSVRILQEAQRYAQQWNQDIYIRFGITGDIRLGKSGKPNYQIESRDGKHKESFHFNGNFFSRTDEFDESNITEGFSISELLELWHLK